MTSFCRSKPCLVQQLSQPCQITRLINTPAPECFWVNRWRFQHSVSNWPSLIKQPLNPENDKKKKFSKNQQQCYIEFVKHLWVNRTDVRILSSLKSDSVGFFLGSCILRMKALLWQKVMLPAPIVSCLKTWLDNVVLFKIAPISILLFCSVQYVNLILCATFLLHIKHME